MKNLTSACSMGNCFFLEISMWCRRNGTDVDQVRRACTNTRISFDLPKGSRPSTASRLRF